MTEEQLIARSKALREGITAGTVKPNQNGTLKIEGETTTPKITPEKKTAPLVIALPAKDDVQDDDAEKKSPEAINGEQVMTIEKASTPQTQKPQKVTK